MAEYPADRLVLNWILGYAQACKEFDAMVDPDVILKVLVAEVASSPPSGPSKKRHPSKENAA